MNGTKGQSSEEAEERAEEQEKKQAKERAIASYVVTELLHEDKTVRDPVHGDIIWNHLETQVIDTEAFQRLRRIKQLGTAHFVFPGAEYSRFLHSLGTLHMAETLLHNIAENRFSQYQQFGETKLQDMAFRLLVRLAALLHDIHEFPLSHTLEKEGYIFPQQWKDKTLNIKMLGRDSDIYKAIYNYIYQLLSQRDAISDYIDESDLDEEEHKILEGLPGLADDERKRVAKLFAETIIAYTYKIVSGLEGAVSDVAEELLGSNEILEDFLESKLLVAANQLVLNTICADLLDYVARDFYFCGIRKTYDERFLKYATITDFHPGRGKKPYPVFAYRLISKRQQIRSSVVSSLFDVLELRYTVAELVHTHRTKNAFSVMAIEAFNYYYQPLDEGKRQKLVDKMLGFGDDELLSYIREKNKTTSYILGYYFNRKPYHEYILWTYRDIDGNTQLKNAINSHIRNPKERFYLQQLLVKEMRESNKIPKKSVRDGDCLLYRMPDPQKLYKELYTNVVCLGENGSAKVDTLHSLSMTDIFYSPGNPMMQALIERTISQRDNLIKKYQNLWHTSVFISPQADLPNIHSIIAQLIEYYFRLIGFKRVSVSAPKDFLPEDIHNKFLALQAESRQFKTFEEIFKSHL